MAEEDKPTEEEQVTVPAQFRCPISMDVMMSPVSLSTGVTYDRSSIESWLALGNRTCPATMQTLPSTQTTPNHTLRRLIHLWMSQPDAVRSPREISKPELIGIIRGELDAESLAKVISFLTASEENLAFVARSDDALSILVSFFGSSHEIRICEQIVGILDLFLPENGVTERLNRLILNGDTGRDPMSSFAMVLREGSTKSKIKSAKLLEQIAFDSESKRKIAETPELLSGLLAICAIEFDTSAIETALSSLVAIAADRPAKKELIRLGIVRTAAKILSTHNNSATAGRNVVEKALATLEAVATCTDGREAIGVDGECVAATVRSLMKCSPAATEHGITVLWSVCCLAHSSAAQETARNAKGLTKVLLVMQSDCSECTRQMCAELVKVLRAKGAHSHADLACYDSMTTHITPY